MRDQPRLRTRSRNGLSVCAEGVGRCLVGIQPNHRWRVYNAFNATAPAVISMVASQRV